MNIKAFNRLYIDKISVKKGNNYDGLVRHNKTAFEKDVNILKLSVYTTSYSCWENAATLIFNTVTDMLSAKSNNIYCFMTSPSWQENTRITGYYGLSRYLIEQFEIAPLEFLFEKMLSNAHEVIFYGVVKLTLDNAKDIFKILADNNNGILFTSLDITNTSLGLLADELATVIVEKNKSSSIDLNIIKTINLILSKDEQALLPYAWEETGTYYLDIFAGG